MAIHNLLDKNIPVYHRFVDNQVLTNDQLNQVIDHINYQDKLTRASLIGVGYMCGIEITKDGHNFEVSGGVAVTSDGDLIKMKDTLYRGYKLFQDERVKYSHFRNDDDTILEMYELKEDSAPTNVKPLSAFDADTGIVDNDKVFIVYLECYTKEEEDCSPLECNAQGQEVVVNIKVLITSYENAQKIAAKDSIFSAYLNAGNANVAVNIPTMYVGRVILNPVNAGSVIALKNAYAVNFTEISNAIVNVGAISLFQDQIDDFPQNIPAFFNSLSITQTNFQYIYDFYKDLVTAFNELADKLNQTYTMCCPDPSAFPKHILRGGLAPLTNTMKHSFYASPIHDHGNSIETLQMLFTRILEMIRNFQTSTKDRIRITPSRHHHFSLGERALPFYYDLDASDDPAAMTASWKLSKKMLLPNFYSFGYPLFFSNPLDYCLDEHDFFRVEGHVGRNVLSAVSDITTIRDQKGLGFDILPIAVGGSASEATIDYDKYSIYFEDLQIILQAWNEEINCIVRGASDFLSNFSAVNPGQHLSYINSKVVNVLPNTEGEAVETRGDLNIRSGSRAIGINGGQKAYLFADATAGAKNTVVEYISEAEGSTGSYWTDVIAVEDNKNDVKVKLQDALADQIENWTIDYQVGSVYIPTDLLGALKDTDDNKLNDIEDFTQENLENFIQSLNIQCNTGKESKKTLQGYVSKSESLLANQNYLEQYYFVLNNIISTCCMIERFRVLYEEILKRKQALLDGLVLKEFIRKHPSAEHKAGVPEGGTLLILYYSKNRIPSVNGSKNLVLNNDNILNKKLGDFNSLAEIIENSASIFNDLKAPQSIVLSDGTVIGDLCIPYICCSQTPATTFVFPDQATNLFIPREFACVPLDEDADLVAITPTPSDGNVQAYVNGNEIGGAVKIINDKYFFDPNAVSTNDYNKEITFTVNGQDVIPVITVYQRPEPEFEISGPNFTNENTKANISVNNKSPEIEGQIFDWDFEVAQFKNELTNFNYAFNVEPGNEYNITLALTATNGLCIESFDLPLEFSVPAIEQPDVDLTIENSDGHICKVPGSGGDDIVLRPTPENATVDVVIDGNVIPNLIDEADGDVLLKTENLADSDYDKLITFRVNNVPVETTFVVNEKPRPSFEVRGTPELSNENTQMTISIRNLSIPISGQVFHWSFGDDDFENNADTFPHTFNVVPGQTFDITLMMRAENGPCSTSAPEVPFSFQVPNFQDGGDGTELSCNDQYLEKISSGEVRIKKYKDENELDAGSTIIFDETITLYEILNGDKAGVMAGNHDTEFNNTISSVQNQIASNYFNTDNLVVIRLYLMLYFETMLMYFYIRACREATIPVNSKITGSWMAFFENLIDEDPEFLKSTLKNEPFYVSLLEEVRSELEPNLSSTLKDLLDQIIATLNEILG